MKIKKYILTALVIIVALILFFKSSQDIEPQRSKHVVKKEILSSAKKRGSLKEYISNTIIKSEEFEIIENPPNFDVYSLRDDLDDKMVETSVSIIKNLKDCLKTYSCDKKRNSNDDSKDDYSYYHKLFKNALDLMIVASRERDYKIEDFFSESELLEILGIGNGEIKLSVADLALTEINGDFEKYARLAEKNSLFKNEHKALFLMMLSTNSLIKDEGREIIERIILNSIEKDDPNTVYQIYAKYLRKLTPKSYYYPSDSMIRKIAKKSCYLDQQITSEAWVLVKEQLVLLGDSRGFQNFPKSICK